MTVPKRPTRPLVLGVVGSDIHSVGYRILEIMLRKAGFKVVGLGAMVPPDEFIKAAIETNACAILMTTLSGFGEFYARDFRKRCEESGLKDVRIYMGGHVTMGVAEDWNTVEARLKALGIDRVASPGTHPREVVRMLEEDLVNTE